MNENNSKVSMYEAVPVVSELNKVSGFDPLKYLRKTKNGWNLDLKIKKLWFRLKYPAGRTRMVTVKITDQLAIMEARVYFDKNDTQPAANFTAQRESKSTPGGLYIEAAQHEAMDEALTAAGFGIQFIPANALEKEQAENHVLVTKQEPEPQQAAPSVAEKISPEAAELKDLPNVTVEAVKSGTIPRRSGESIVLTSEMRAELLAYIRRKGIKDGLVFRTASGRVLDRKNVHWLMNSVCATAQVAEEKVSPRTLQRMYQQTRAEIHERVVLQAERDFQQLLFTEQRLFGWEEKKVARLP